MHYEAGNLFVPGPNPANAIGWLVGSFFILAQ